MLKLTGKNIMITGGAGFIGSYLAERIAKENPNKIVILDNLFLGKEENLDTTKSLFPNLIFLKINCTNYESMRTIIIGEKIDIVFNLATIPLPTSLIKPKWSSDVNILMVTTMCELLREGFYKTLIHYSSSEAYGSAHFIPMHEDHPINPETPYAASKVSGDYIIMSYINTFGIDASIIRPFNNYGPRQNKGEYAAIIPIVINKIIKGEPIIIYGDGEQTRDFIFVKDTVDATIRIYEEEKTRGKIINIASGVETSMNNLIHKIISLMKSDIEILHGKSRPGDVRRHCADVSLAQNLIGFKPKILSDKNLEETIEYYLQTKKEN